MTPRKRDSPRLPGHHDPLIACRCRAVGLLVALAATGCTVTLDAGSSRPPGKLPVDERNAIMLLNDGPNDNWAGEYAVLLANGGGSPLAGIIVNASIPWPDIAANVAGWRDLVTAARTSGLRNIPDPIASIGSPLVRPTDGAIDATAPNRSEGASLIVEASKRFGLPNPPLVIVTGGALTDLADAYLVDPTVTERVIVVSSLGQVNGSGASMGAPNGELDPWANTIVAARFRYVQVSAFYDQLTDVPDAGIAQLPANALGTRIAAKQPNIWHWSPASDQVAVIAVGLPSFVTTVERAAPGSPIGVTATAGPDLLNDPNGPTWVVTECAGATATTRLWELLRDPKTYAR